MDYAVVGGQAVALHGVVRGTIDVDVALRWTRQTVVDAEAALRGMGLESRIPVTAGDVFDLRDYAREYARERHLIAWNFLDPEAPMAEVDIVINYDLAGKNVADIRLSSGLVRVLSRGDLIEMKQRSGRPQDLADADALEGLG